MIAADPHPQAAGPGRQGRQRPTPRCCSPANRHRQEVFARYLHEHSPAAAAPLAINCGDPDTLLEATLFGHEERASPAPPRAQPGKVRAGRGRHAAPWTKSPRCPSACRPSCCACCRARGGAGGGQEGDSAGHPRAGHHQPRHGEGSGRRAFPGGSVLPPQCSRWRSRRSASGRAISCRWPGTSRCSMGRVCGTSAQLSAEAEAVLVMYHWPVMCANSRTPCGGR